MGRIREPEPEELSPEQKRVYDAVLRSRGAAHGPFRAWLHSPELADRAQRLGEYVRYHTVLDERLSELAILVVARHWSAQIEWSLHEPEALRAGIARETVQAVKEKRKPRAMPDDEDALYDFVRALVDEGFVRDETFERVREHLGDRGVTELTVLVGYYTLVAWSLNAFEIPLPAEMERLLPDAPG